jgi:integrase
MSLLMLLRRMGHRDITAHGFRSTFRDWAAEKAARDRHRAQHDRQLAPALASLTESGDWPAARRDTPSEETPTP